MSDAVIVGLIAVAGSLAAVCLSGVINYKIEKLKKAQQETHNLFNSRMDELLRIQKELAKAQGMEEGEKKGRADNIKEQTDRDNKKDS